MKGFTTEYTEVTEDKEIFKDSVSSATSVVNPLS
jgi:hypothetical protein